MTEFHPADNFIRTREGRKISYAYLVVALGIQIDWDKIPGLREGLGQEPNLQQLCLPAGRLHLGLHP